MMSEDNNIPKFGDELKKNPFSTPNGYFDQLPSRIQEKCAAPDESKKSWIKMLVPQLGFVLGFVVLVLLAKGFFKMVGHTSENIQDNTVALADSALHNGTTTSDITIDDGMIIDDTIISYLVDNNISDLDIVQ